MSEHGIDSRIVVANDYYLAAQIDLYTRGSVRLFDTDDQRIHRHGRTLNREAWGRDEATLAREFAGQDALIVILNRNRHLGHRLPLTHLRQRFARVDPVCRVCLYGDRRCYSYFIGREVQPQ